VSVPASGLDRAVALAAAWLRRCRWRSRGRPAGALVAGDAIVIAGGGDMSATPRRRSADRIGRLAGPAFDEGRRDHGDDARDGRVVILVATSAGAPAGGLIVDPRPIRSPTTSDLGRRCHNLGPVLRVPRAGHGDASRRPHSRDGGRNAGGELGSSSSSIPIRPLRCCCRWRS
jgi:hypothetical protein